MATKRCNLSEISHTYKKPKINHNFITHNLLTNTSLSEILYNLSNNIQLLEFKINKIDQILTRMINTPPLNNHQSSYII